MGIFEKIANWYFTKKAVPYWGILLLDCLIVVISGLVCYTLDHGASSCHHRHSFVDA